MRRCPPALDATKSKLMKIKTILAARAYPRALRGFAIGALCLFGALAHAESTPSHPEAARAKLEGIAQQMVVSLQNPGVRQNVSALQQLVIDVLVPHIDFRVSANLVLGSHWKDATESQRIAFMNEFQSFLVRFYTGALASYVDSKEIPLDIMAFREAPIIKDAVQAKIRSHIGQADGEEVAVEYRMYWREGSWKVVDVSVAGISMVQSYRSSFTSTVKDKGLDALINQLHARNQSFASN